MKSLSRENQADIIEAFFGSGSRISLHVETHRPYIYSGVAERRLRYFWVLAVLRI